ncbi:MAG: ferredoxin-type protein NapF [Paracoccus sp. (in: a-proteobacteria)]|uniref:ferredoxin-type protein NapF n=1 Tax=Paracoccus sp. TaxID=267 RepID=UPI0026E0B99C|nr:ferredoxin-type protein NapF [Paracoccus sp. (in: a-proteobacteria)]MDO5631083.1 ferredoxin-type protein NapF [Paracoccus sp. (in: a-proteobacteria)]
MSATPSARRNFLRGRFQRLDDDAMQPPWAVADMVDLCTSCGDCARACPQGIILRDADHRPVVDLHRDACTFCRACADACETGALDPALPLDWPWRANVTLDNCLSAQGVYCRACEDSCDALAIRFRLAVGGRSLPIIDFGQCTGCGACASVCPNQAVGFARHAAIQKEKAKE